MTQAREDVVLDTQLNSVARDVLSRHQLAEAPVPAQHDALLRAIQSATAPPDIVSAVLAGGVPEAVADSAPLLEALLHNDDAVFDAALALLIRRHRTVRAHRTARLLA